MKLYFLFLFLIISLIIRFFTHYQSQKHYVEGEELTFSARLLTIPEQKGRLQTFSLKPEGYEELYISVPLYPEYEYGQVLTVSGVVKLSQGEKKVFPVMRYPKITVRQNDSLLYGLIRFVRDKVIRLYASSLPPTSASLLMGIVFGIKQGMSTEFKAAFKEVGVFHVVAASGMNVTLVAGFFMVIFGNVFKRQVALVLSIVAIMLYAFLAGLEPSILRASLMGSIVFLSGILGRQHIALWTLGVTGYLMLLMSPSLISDIGFQLSFLATLGILVIKPAISFSQSRAGKRNDNVATQDFKTTLAAQLGTTPVLLSAFGQVSLLSLLVNMLVLWTIPPLMIIGSASALIGFVFEPLGKLIVFFALPLLLYFEWVALFFAKYNLSLKVRSFPWWATAGYYLLLFVVLLWWRKNLSSRAKRGDLA